MRGSTDFAVGSRANLAVVIMGLKTKIDSNRLDQHLDLYQCLDQYQHIDHYHLDQYQHLDCTDAWTLPATGPVPATGPLPAPGSVPAFLFFAQVPFLSRSAGLDHAEGASIRFMVASGGVLSEGYGHDGPGVCLGDCQTKAEGLLSQDGRGDALLRRMSPYLT